MYRGRLTLSTMAIRISQARKIEGGQFEGKKALYMDVTILPEENGTAIPFLALEKSSRKLTRLLCVERDYAKNRPLARTDIIEQIRALRDKAFLALVGKTDWDVSRKTLRSRADKARALMFDETVAPITVPPIDDIPEYTMKVVLTQPNNMLLAEFNIENIEYLRTVVNKQIVNGNIKTKYKRGFNNEGHKGISALYADDGSVKALRIKRASSIIDGDDKASKKQKTFIKVDGDLAEATGRAISLFDLYREPSLGEQEESEIELESSEA